jgi:hypothetical protein
MVRYIDNSGATKAVAITPDDDTDIDVTRGLYVGGAGDLVVVLGDDDTPMTFTAIAAGVIHPLRVKRVMEASTANGILGVY